MLQRLVHNKLRVGSRGEEAAQSIAYAGVSSASPIGYFPDFTGDRGMNHTVAFEVKKNPEVSQEVLTDVDPLNPYTLAGTLFGAFGYVGLLFAWCFPEVEEETPRQFKPLWEQAIGIVPRGDAAAGGAEDEPASSVDNPLQKVAQEDAE